MRSHSLHGADFQAELVEAYTSMPTMCAASQSQLTSFDTHQFLHWQHSIQSEYNYLSPFAAVMSAWKLGWNVLCDQVEAHTGIGWFDDGDSIVQGKQNRDHCKNCSEGCVLPNSCFRKHSERTTRSSKSVRFHKKISIHIGLEDELQMQCVPMNTFALADWTEKPWTKKAVKSAGDIARPTTKKIVKPSFSQARLTDEHDDIPRRVAAESTEPPNAQRNRPQQVQPPDFAIDIFGLPGFLALPHDFLMENSFLIRTWYVHHFHHPRWVVPRFVELDHRWVLWQREIASAWRDMLQPNEDVRYFTIMPDPDRSYIPRQAVADVIVVQGIDADRSAGLLTVHQQNAQGHIRPFALAISLPDEVSGIGLAAAADISHLCNTQNCNFHFRWQPIPFSLIPAHYMHDGHGFSVHITPRVRQTARSSGESSPSHTRAAATVGRGHDQAEERSNGQLSQAPANAEDDDSEHTTGTPIPGSPTQFEQWQGVQIYRLNRHVVHCFVRWGTYNSILYDISRFLRAPLRNLIGIHHIQAILAGQHEAEDSVILQYTDDLALGSTEQLVILDVEVHFQVQPVSWMRAPEVTRRVHRIVPQIARPFVLRIARLTNYCFLQGDRCLVFLNNELWPEQDQSVRRIQHGDYLRVVATPPLDHAVSTEAALNFAITIDDAEADIVRDCTTAPRRQQALSLVQTNAECRVGFDRDHNPLHLHVHRYHIDADDHEDDENELFYRLKDRFSLQALVECSDEGPIAYVTTWFIDHLTAPRCETYRSVRLVGQELGNWRRQLIETWADHVNPSIPVHIAIVTPQPPATETETTLVHILLEQNSAQATHAAGVLSTIRQDQDHAFVNHVAVSIGSTATSRHVLQKIHLVDLCVLRRCLVKYGNTDFVPGNLEELGPAFNIVVSVAPLRNDGWIVPEQLWTPGMAAAMDAHTSSTPFIEDDVVFTQTSLEIQPKVCKPSPHGPMESRGIPVIHPESNPRRRIRPLHDGAEDWITPIGELFPLYGVHNAWDNVNLLPVKTWFVHHLRRTACLRPRDIQLSDHPIMWIEELRNAWMDLLDPRLPFSIHVVKPRPPQFRSQRHACHIILEQGHQPCPYGPF